MDRERREDTESWLRLRSQKIYPNDSTPKVTPKKRTFRLGKRITLYRLKNIDGSRLTTIIPPTDEETIHDSWDIDKGDLRALGKEIGEYFESDFTIDWRTE